MILASAISDFCDHTRRIQGPTGAVSHAGHAEAINLLLNYFSPTDDLPVAITGDRLRDFLARWYIEESSAHRQKQSSPASPNEDQINFPEPEVLLNSLEGFFTWAGEQRAKKFSDSLEVIKELKESLPRAMRIGEMLSEDIAGRGGPFGFPEFLTSFEEGGHSEYDVGAAGEPGAVEAYFRIVSVDSPRVEAEDLISGERFGPIIFPQGVAQLISPGFIMNLELVRAGNEWRIGGVGLVYPPGTEI